MQTFSKIRSKQRCFQESNCFAELLFEMLLYLSFIYCWPRLVTGSPEGYAGHVDGRLRDAKLNHPKGLAVDDRGNIYVADTVNNAIRKISEAGK